MFKYQRKNTSTSSHCFVFSVSFWAWVKEVIRAWGAWNDKLTSSETIHCEATSKHTCSAPAGCWRVGGRADQGVEGAFVSEVPLPQRQWSSSLAARPYLFHFSFLCSICVFYTVSLLRLCSSCRDQLWVCWQVLLQMEEKVWAWYSSVGGRKKDVMYPVWCIYQN